MIEEKQYQNTKWFVSRELKFRQKELDGGKICVWVSLEKSNICFTMIMYDFIEWCQEIDIDLEIDMSWNNHRGFVIEGKDQTLIRSEIKRFINLNNITPDDNDEKFSDDEWYSLWCYKMSRQLF